MEGLLPMVYKAIKRKKHRSRYECLSSGAANSFDEAWPLYTTKTHAAPLPSQDMHGHHRRSRSMGEYAFGKTSRDRDDHDGMRSLEMVGMEKESQLMRFRSHRSFRNRMFSCVSVAE